MPSILLVQARTPVTYWGYQYCLPMVGKAASLPPLGLVSLAALLPASWQLRLVDLNIAELTDEDVRWADAVFVSGMLVQERSMHEALAHARRLGRRTVAGGPAPTTSPQAFADADHVFQGEAEGRLDFLVRAVEHPDEPAPFVLSPPDEARPAMSQVPVPRFDLLALEQYGSMSIQYSRGCPYLCEFCDVIEVFGRVPRVKSPAQVLAELDALFQLGYRGPLFFVDDNFIGNRKAVAELLPRLTAWQREHGRPFDLYTEASINLATLPELGAAMVEAGFSSIFVGLETPAEESLKEARKHQNLKLAPAEAVHVLTRAGLEVMAGFIVGFDSDGPEIFEAQRRFISSLPIPMAMVGVLTALPGTALWRRLEREGRLRRRATGDQFDRTNFTPVMDELALLLGYRELMAHLYSPEGYYARCEWLVEERGRPPEGGQRRPDSMLAFARAVVQIGLRAPYRRRFWRLLGLAARRAPHNFAHAVRLAILGEHLIRYTREDVLPRLDQAIQSLEAERARYGVALPDERPAPGLVDQSLQPRPSDGQWASA